MPKYSEVFYITGFFNTAEYVRMDSNNKDSILAGEAKFLLPCWEQLQYSPGFCLLRFSLHVTGYIYSWSEVQAEFLVWFLLKTPEQGFEGK